MQHSKQSSHTHLKNSYLFQNFDDAQLNEIVNITDCRIYEAGERIFQQNSEAKSLFVIGHGTVAIEINDDEDFESPPVLLGSGATFGESHFHLREKRLGSAMIKERTEIYEIDYQRLSAFFEDSPNADLKFTKALALHLGRYCHHLIEGMMEKKAKIFVNEGITSFV